MPETSLNGRKSVQRLSRRYLKCTAYGLLILLAVMLQSTPHVFPTVASARPILIIPVVLFIAMFEGPVGGGAAGVAGGFLWDIYADRLLGFNALVLLIICCACGLLVRLLVRNNLISAMLLAAAALLIQGIFDWFFNYVLTSQVEVFYVLLRHTFPNILYTLVLSPLLYAAIYGTARLLRNRE